MSTLLLRLAAPIQAWGDESKYDIRGTKNEPTKSGVIGMIAAAMGYRRDSEEINEIAEKLRIGIRVDQPGIIIRDFHTARTVKHTYTTQRYYLCDACFMVGLESDDLQYLNQIKEALKYPVFPLYLGRRSCPPELPIVAGLQDESLETVLHQAEWAASDWYKSRYKQIRARIIIETQRGQNAWSTRMDQPVSFNPVHRKYTVRGVDKEQYVLLGSPEHDPMSAL